jgi:hypothetical protein
MDDTTRPMNKNELAKLIAFEAKFLASLCKGVRDMTEGLTDIEKSVRELFPAQWETAFRARKHFECAAEHIGKAAELMQKLSEEIPAPAPVVAEAPKKKQRKGKTLKARNAELPTVQ